MTDDRTAPHPHTHHLRVQRTARYFTLGGSAPKTIWFVLHGYGQLAGEFIRYFSDLAGDDSLIVAPEALSRFYLLGVDKAPARDRPVGATWMTREDRDSEIADYVEYLEALYTEIAATPVSFGAKVNVIGFSQGAATATRWIAHGTSHIDRLILWGGLAPPEIDFKRGPSVLRQVPLTYVMGSRDHYLTAEVVAAERARLDAAQVPYQVITFDGGHVVSRQVFAQLGALPLSGASGR